MDLFKGFTRSTLLRTAWTFIEAFFAFVLLNGADVTNTPTAKLVLGGAVAAGIAAVKNFIFPPGSPLR